MAQLYNNTSFISLKGLRFSLSLFLCIIVQYDVYSQILKSEYIGAIVTTDKKTMLYNIHLKFNSSNNEFTGYSTTDRDKKNETICLIKGSYDPKKNILKFSEYKIQQTKSKARMSDMCFIHFEGKLFHKNENVIKGKFVGKYPDRTSCVDGQIFLASKEILLSTMDSVMKTKDTIINEVKKELPLVDVLKNGQTRFVKTKADSIMVSIWDDHKLDNDIIDLYIDDKLYESNIVLSKKPIYLNLHTKTTRKIVIKAKNVGYIAPNTAKISVQNNGKTILILNELDINQSSEVKIIKE